MPEIVKYMQSEELIIVEGFGKVTYNHVKKTIEQGINYNKEYQVKRVVSNHQNVESIPQEVDVFNLGAMIAQRLKGFSIALIYPESFKEYYSLFAKAANSRGGNIKLFENKYDAFHWLCRARQQELVQ